ncbi:hypothetical protein [Nonomuraea harbinensis]|uniref:Transcriptional regulator n=1 Tax=Nonomuraea harbinensis TaxID=1286938 RepID=A0ABW1BWG4_9ACTN|nr:hypothetical protein [Nonomuraea harbinensis]
MALPSRSDGLLAQIPDSLTDLRGPVDGKVALPPHLSWSGPREYDLADLRLRLSMYRMVITGGGRVDAERYLNARHLTADWPLLRKGLGPGHRRAWEHKLALGMHP